MNRPRSSFFVGMLACATIAAPASAQQAGLPKVVPAIPPGRRAGVAVLSVRRSGLQPRLCRQRQHCAKLPVRRSDPSRRSQGSYIQCGNNQLLSYWAPGNIYSQRGTLSLYWRSRDPVDQTEFPVFRVGYADHSSWDQTRLSIDYNGHHIRSAYFSGTKMSEDGVWGWSKSRSYYVFQPALSLVLYNGAPETKKMMLEMADGLFAHRKLGPGGRYTINSSINFKANQEATGLGGGFGGGGGAPWFIMWSAYRWTGDKKYLQPLLTTASRCNRPTPTQSTSSICATPSPSRSLPLRRQGRQEANSHGR